MMIEIYPTPYQGNDDGVSVCMDGTVRRFPHETAAFEFLDAKKRELSSCIDTAISMYYRLDSAAKELQKQETKQ